MFMWKGYDRELSNLELRGFMWFLIIFPLQKNLEWWYLCCIWLLQVLKPLNQVLSSLIDQEVGHQIDNHNLSSVDLHRTYTVEEYEVRILEPDRAGGPWQTRATIPMQSAENALTVRVVTLFVSSLFCLCINFPVLQSSLPC